MAVSAKDKLTTEQQTKTKKKNSSRKSSTKPFM